jgi:hypothetical protein
LGERTKLHLCSSCCKDFLCNINSIATQNFPPLFLYFTFSFLISIPFLVQN